MHGLINRSIQCFIRDTYGPDRWAEVARGAELGFVSFEALLTYPDHMTVQVIDVACEILGKPCDTFLEDLGTYLVSHPNLEPVRRLLRFGGETFMEFLCSLDDLPERARLAVPDLILPMIEVRDHSTGSMTIRISRGIPGFGVVLVGVLRAIADDYGTLALLEHKGRSGHEELISVQLLETAFSQGREFKLAPKGA